MSANQFQESLDTDWFLSDQNGIVIHVASAGGKLPKSVQEQGENLNILINYFRSLPESNENVIINPKLHDYLQFKSQEEEVRYLRDFVFMAQRGLYSYDKSVLGNFDDTSYHLVAYPSKSKIHLKDIPEKTRGFMKTQILGDIATRESISIEEID